MIDLATCPSLIKRRVLFHQCHRFWMTVIIRKDKDFKIKRETRELHVASSLTCKLIFSYKRDEKEK